MSSPERRELFADRDFVCYWSARTSSIAGSSVSFLVLPVLAYQISGSALTTGLVTGLNAVAYLLTGLFAGLAADRYDRKRLMVTADWGRAVFTALIPILYATGHLNTGWLMAVVVINATLFVFFDAANLGALKAIVGAGRLAEANGVVWSAGTVAEIAAPGLAGLLLAVTSAANLMIIDAVTFLASALLVHAIRTPLSAARTARQRLRKELAAGAAFIWHHAALRAATAATVGQAIAEGLVVGQLVVYAATVLHVREGDPWLGACYGAISVGALIASLALPAMSRRWPIQRIILASLAISTVMLGILALTRVVVLAVLVLTIWALAYLLTFVGTATFRQQVAPDELQGRVSVMGRMVSGGAGVSAGALIGGIITQAVGVGWAVGLGAVLTGLTFAAVLQPLRHAATTQRAEEKTDANLA